MDQTLRSPGLRPALIIDDGGQPYEITTLWAWVVVHGPDQEGIASIQHSGSNLVLPMVVSKLSTAEAMRPMVTNIARKTGKKIVLKQFTASVVLEEVNP